MYFSQLFFYELISWVLPTACTNYMVPNVHCPKKAVNLNLITHSLTWALPIKLVLGECHGTLLMISKVISWWRQATSHYLSQCWPRSLSSTHHMASLDYNKLNNSMNSYFTNEVYHLRKSIGSSNYLLLTHWGLVMPSDVIICQQQMTYCLLAPYLT